MFGSRGNGRLIAAGVALCVSQVPAAAQAPPMSRRAHAYLQGALDTLQAVIIRSDTVSWRNVRDTAFLVARGAQEERDTYGAVAWALRRANSHSFLQARPGGVAWRMLAGRVGYVRVPQINGAGVPAADSIHGAIRSLDSAGACGWIVDLRSNGGGNMWPMLAGAGPLLGDSIVGSFGDPALADRWLYRDGAAFLLKPDGRRDTVSVIRGPAHRLKDALPPVAVLMDGITGSSGEALALAFRGRPNTRSYGTPTAGAATANRGSRLPDGANMVVTAGYMADRTGAQSDGRVQPDSIVDVPAPVFPGWPFATDAAASVARSWVSSRPHCRPR